MKHDVRIIVMVTLSIIRTLGIFLNLCQQRYDVCKPEIIFVLNLLSQWLMQSVKIDHNIFFSLLAGSYLYFIHLSKPNLYY
jgi:hypothetical protein